jgi:hypothetical protein
MPTTNEAVWRGPCEDQVAAQKEGLALAAEIDDLDDDGLRRFIAEKGLATNSALTPGNRSLRGCARRCSRSGTASASESTNGWRIESYGSHEVLAHEVGGTLDAEISEGKNRAEIIARLYVAA